MVHSKKIPVRHKSVLIGRLFTGFLSSSSIFACAFCDSVNHVLSTSERNMLRYSLKNQQRNLRNSPFCKINTFLSTLQIIGKRCLFAVCKYHWLLYGAIRDARKRKVKNGGQDLQMDFFVWQKIIGIRMMNKEGRLPFLARCMRISPVSAYI